MAVWHGEKGRKPTGGLIKVARKKKKHELGSLPTYTRVGKEKRKKVRVRGGEIKIRALSVEFANVFDQETKTSKKVKILDVIENKANPHFVRRGIVTKGCIIKTELGNARVTSRPSQDGVVNAVLLKEKS
ncbi:MAG: 30S ribosomal protein S8e [Candidatus Aenigmarchaeota archaeon]|nr:30S ribosomal protein S8e [Candidatus Aenigmarchaeota archaeon]